MTVVTQSPVIDLESIDYNAKPDVSFRVLTDYVIQVDSYVTRIDVLLAGGTQLHTAMVARAPLADYNNQVVRGVDLALPTHLVKRGNATVSFVNKTQLIAVLRGMADALEKT